LLVDTGMRRAELAGMTVGDVDLRMRMVSVVGKGDRKRQPAIGHKTAQAIDRYLRARLHHAQAWRDDLWLGLAGPLAKDGNGIAPLPPPQASERADANRRRLNARTPTAGV